MYSRPQKHRLDKSTDRLAVFCSVVVKFLDPDVLNAVLALLRDHNIEDGEKKAENYRKDNDQHSLGGTVGTVPTNTFYFVTITSLFTSIIALQFCLCSSSAVPYLIASIIFKIY
jgi:hypothetical protein